MKVQKNTFREQLTAMKAEDEEDAERIDSNKTPTDEFQPNILPRLSSKDYSKELGMPTQQEHSESTTALQVQVRKGNKAVPPVIPPKSPHRPQTMLKSASHSLDLKSRPAITHLDENHHPLKRRDFVNEGFKESAHLTPHKPHMLRSSRSENALDRHYNSGHDDNPSSLEDERTKLTLSRLGFHSNKRNDKFHRLYKSNQAYTGSDEDLGFSTNVTPSSHRSSRLIRSVAALKSLSKRITSRKSQLFDFSQKIQSNKEVKGINSDQSTQSNLSNNFDSDTQRNGSLSPFQQVYARAWPIRKASKSPMAVANKMQNYF
ncbi:hypothetical protein L7F22_043867 [Adiantum nelumboides]|nr:hypothetical protein [Adiantum nelumboides]